MHIRIYLLRLLRILVRFQHGVNVSPAMQNPNDAKHLL
jgi:hypothetical protein